MNQLLIAVLACFVLAVDLVITRVRVRQRAPSKSITREPTLTEEDLGDEPKEGVAIE